MELLSEAWQWAAASTAKQDEIVDTLLSTFDGCEVTYENDYCLEHPIRIISISDVASKIVFNLIPGGTFTMGFSQAENGA